MPNITNVWQGSDFTDHRRAVATRWLSGEGIEIGGLHKPVVLPPDAVARYVDLRTYDQGSTLNAHEVLVPHIVDNGFTLDSLDDNSVDFVIGNHLLEHSPDFYGTVKRWLTKLRPGGIVYAAVPIVDRCFDDGRIVTTCDHIFEDHVAFAGGDIKRVLEITRDHLLEFALVSGRNILTRKKQPFPTYDNVYRFVDRLMNELHHEIEQVGARSWDQLMKSHGSKINLVYDLHYHTFLPNSIEALLEAITTKESIKLEEIRKSGGGECIFVLRKCL